MMKYLLAVLALIALPVQAEIQIEELETESGIAFWFVEAPEIPMVAMNIRFDGGGRLDREGKRGEVNLMAAMLNEGAGARDAQAFQIALDDLASEFSVRPGDDAVSISARFLTDTMAETAALVHEALTEPRFDADALERNRAQVLSGIASSAQDPQSIASETYFAALFPEHPYGSDISGTAESVAALTAEDLRAAHERALVRDRATIGIVGDLSADEATALVEQVLEGVPETGPDLPATPEMAELPATTVVDFPTPQSVAIFGQPGMDQESPDFFAAYILSTLMGGRGPESILMREVREERGLTYGVYADLLRYDQADLYLGSVASANAKMAEAMEVIRAEWARMAEEGITAEELSRAQTYLTGEYPLRFDSNAAIAGILVGMQVTERSPDYINTRNDQVNAVTLDDVNRVAAELYQPDALSFVIVGQPEGVESSQ